MMQQLIHNSATTRKRREGSVRRGTRRGFTRRGFTRRGFTMLEVLGALAVATILLVTLTWIQVGGTASYSERVDERRAQYIASVMRQIFEAEKERLLNEYEEHGYLSNMGLSGGTGTIPNRQVYRISNPITDVRLLGRFEQLVPRAGTNFSARRAGGRYDQASRETPTDGDWLAREGYMPLGRATGLDPRAFNGIATDPVIPVNIYYGRIRPDALLSGLCRPSVTRVDTDQDGTDGTCRAERYDLGRRVGANTATTLDPDYGYVPRRTLRPTTLGLAMRDIRTGSPSGNIKQDQMLFPFLGYYGSEGSTDKILVTDDTALTLVLKTNFTDAQIPNERVLRRVSELLAPYGGYGLHTSHNSSALDYYKCLPHMTDIRGLRSQTACADEIYTPRNNAIIGGGLAWRYLARELPLRDARQNLFDTNPISGVIPSVNVRRGLRPLDDTVFAGAPLRVQGQIFMVGVFGRRNSAQHALEVASFDSRAQMAAAPSLYFTEEYGLRDAGTSQVDSTKNEHAGRNFGFVFGEEITIEGDLIIQADTIIEGEKFLYSGGSTPQRPLGRCVSHPYCHSAIGVGFEGWGFLFRTTAQIGSNISPSTSRSDSSLHRPETL